MHTLIKSVTRRDLLLQQLPAFALSLFISEFFYKFHSFTLEAVAFLSTWYLLDWIIGFVSAHFSREQG